MKNQRKRFQTKFLKNKDKNYLKILKEKRRIGENDNYVCELIRKDSLDEFINYTASRYGSTIEHSIFEINIYLCSRDLSYIYYATFFGFVRIFKYLYPNECSYDKKGIWLYAMHCPNEDIIQILEKKNRDEPPPEDFNSCIKDPYCDNTFEIFLQKAIKCHHNELVIYILENHIDAKDKEWKIDNHYRKNIYTYAFQYSNFQFYSKRHKL